MLYWIILICVFSHFIFLTQYSDKDLWISPTTLWSGGSSRISPYFMIQVLAIEPVFSAPETFCHNGQTLKFIGFKSREETYQSWRFCCKVTLYATCVVYSKYCCNHFTFILEYSKQEDIPFIVSELSQWISSQELLLSHWSIIINLPTE